jgi:hypothetical protein
VCKILVALLLLPLASRQEMPRPVIALVGLLCAFLPKLQAEVPTLPPPLPSGSGNNQFYPQRGAAGSAFIRLLRGQFTYADSKEAPSAGVNARHIVSMWLRSHY